MSTHNDYNIANQSGTALLTDLNELLDAVRSNSSDNAQPTNFGDYQFWVDTLTNELKLRVPGGTILNLCNIDTGEFQGVAQVSNSTLLDNSTLSFYADNTTVMKRDVSGSVTGNIATGYTLTGDAGSIANPVNDAAYFLDSNNLTGVCDAQEVTAGSYIHSYIDLGIIANDINTEGTGIVRIKPMRFGTYTVRWSSEESGQGSISLYPNSNPGGATTFTTGTSGSVNITIDGTVDYEVVIDMTNLDFNWSHSITLEIAEYGWTSPIASRVSDSTNRYEGFYMADGRNA